MSPSPLAAFSCSQAPKLITLFHYSSPVFLWTLDLFTPFSHSLRNSLQPSILNFSLFLFLTKNGIFFFPFLFHCWNTSSLSSSWLFAIPLFSFLFPLLSRCQPTLRRGVHVRNLEDLVAVFWEHSVWRLEGWKSMRSGNLTCVNLVC